MLREKILAVYDHVISFNPKTKKNKQLFAWNKFRKIGILSALLTNIANIVQQITQYLQSLFTT